MLQMKEAMKLILDDLKEGDLFTIMKFRLVNYEKRIIRKINVRLTILRLFVVFIINSAILRKCGKIRVNKFMV